MSRDSVRSAVVAADSNSVFVPEVTKGSRKCAEAIVEGMGLEGKRLDVIESDTMPLTKVPDVIGMGAKDAVYAIQKRGMRVRINGCGQIVKQDIAPGSPATKGKTIILTAEAKIK